MNAQSSNPRWMDRHFKQKQGSARVAVADDDPEHLELMRRVLQAIGFSYVAFPDGDSALRALRRETFDLLIVDWQMPGINGPDVVMWVREHDMALPIIFVTARNDESDIVKGFACGADDYIVKPVKVGELVARIRAVLRRTQQRTSNRVLEHRDIVIDRFGRLVTVAGELVELKGREFELADCLFSNLGRVLSRKYIVEAVWGFGVEQTSRALDTMVSSLRRKLGLRPELGYRLSAVYSVGYRLESLDDFDTVESAGMSEALE